MKTFFACCICLCTILNIKAQNSTVTSGGNASGSNGNVSYSVGQINYITESGPNGVVTQGVQQPFEITVVTGIEKNDIDLKPSVYPNPSTGQLTISLNKESLQEMSYIIYDVAGKVIAQKKLIGKETHINMNEKSEGIYYIRILSDKSELKTFKIVKNK